MQVVARPIYRIQLHQMFWRSCLILAAPQRWPHASEGLASVLIYSIYSIEFFFCVPPGGACRHGMWQRAQPQVSTTLYPGFQLGLALLKDVIKCVALEHEAEVMHF